MSEGGSTSSSDSGAPRRFESQQAPPSAEIVPPQLPASLENPAKRATSDTSASEETSSPAPPSYEHAPFVDYQPEFDRRNSWDLADNPFSRSSPSDVGNRRGDDSPFLGTQPVSIASRLYSGEHPLTHVENAPSHSLLRSAPPWLVSMVLHMLAIIIAGVIIFPDMITPSIMLEVIANDTSGEELELVQFDASATIVESDTGTSQNDVTFSEDVLAHTRSPLVTGRPVETIAAPQVTVALSGRTKGMKEALLAAYGGNVTTEASVEMALEWLERNQRSTGLWSLSKPYSNGAAAENRTSATAMALLAFLGAGHTHQEGDYRNTVDRGWRALLKDQKNDGDFWQGGIMHHRLYSQAQVTIGICELYGMSRDENFREPAQRAVDYAVSIQAPGGGWRYEPKELSDTSVTGWFLMALQSARMAGLKVDSEAFEKVSRYLDAAASADGSRYGYLPRTANNPVMTAEALLCRQYLGWKRDDPRLVAGVEYVSLNPIDFMRSNSYYWYYATQVLHHMDDQHWDLWNEVMRVELPERQEKEGRERGSWSPTGDRWGSHGGRLYMTAMCTYMLEVYYRHLPIYAEIYGFH